MDGQFSPLRTEPTCGFRPSLRFGIAGAATRKHLPGRIMMMKEEFGKTPCRKYVQISSDSSVICAPSEKAICRVRPQMIGGIDRLQRLAFILKSQPFIGVLVIRKSTDRRMLSAASGTVRWFHVAADRPEHGMVIPYDLPCQRDRDVSSVAPVAVMASRTAAAVFLFGTKPAESRRSEQTW